MHPCSFIVSLGDTFCCPEAALQEPVGLLSWARTGESVLPDFFIGVLEMSISELIISKNDYIRLRTLGGQRMDDYLDESIVVENRIGIIP